MALDALGISALLGGGSALLQSVIGGIQAYQGNKGFKRTMANRPDYEIPSEYQDILAKYQQAQAGNMPGYEQLQSNIGQAGARARGAAERGAISSTAYGAQVGDIYQKELDAIQNLGIQQEQYKTQMLDKVAGAQGQLAGQKAEQWNINKFLPWQTEMNRYGEQKSAGMQNLFSGIQSGIGSVSDFLGTKYYTDALTGLQGGNNISAPKGGNFFQSKPMSTPTPQQNLLNTLEDKTSKIKLNWGNG